MGIATYRGETFVAYTDISGFKKMMLQPDAAANALDAFYSAGFEILNEQRLEVRVDGLFVSDCAILFSRNEPRNDSAALVAMLHVVRELNQRMLERQIMLTTSIVFGPFDYEDRITVPGITKGMLHGSAYLSAYLDCSSGKPKLNAGECRILSSEHDDLAQFLPLDALRFQLRKIKNCTKFFWSCSTPEAVDALSEMYGGAEDQLHVGFRLALENSSRRV